MGGGDRTLKFTKDSAIKEVTAKFDGNAVISILGKSNSLNIRVPPGLPNNTRPLVTYYQNYNFEREEWWPKFQRTGITVIKGDKAHKSRVTKNKITNNNSTNNYNISKSSENLSNNVNK